MKDGRSLRPPTFFATVWWLLVSRWARAYGADPTLSVGGAGWALRFDGTNDFVLLEADLPEVPWTIEMWVMPQSLTDGDGQSVVSFDAKGSLLSKYSLLGGDKILEICYNGEEAWYPTTTHDAGFTDEVTPSTAVGQLYHIAVSKTENASSIFVNGELGSYKELEESDYVASSALETPWVWGGRMVLVGRKWVTDDRNFGGTLDEMRWWRGARTTEQLKQYMHRPVPDNDPDLVKQWKIEHQDGDTVAGSYSLGGGNSFNSPVWVPSPVTSTGGSVAISTRSTAPTTTAQVCGLFQYADGDQGVSVTLTLLSSSTLGDLSVLDATMALSSDLDFSDAQRFCSSVQFKPSTAGFELVPFEVVVTTAGGATVSAQQNVSILVSGNMPPSAGAARAVTTDGVESYLSLGSWELSENWTMSVWLDPISSVNDVWILSQHYSAGKNLFMLGYFGLGYRLRMGCYHTGSCAEEGTWARNYPLEQGDELVLASGRTANEVETRKMEPHHLALSFTCFTRGNATTGEAARGWLKVYQDGLLVGDEEWPLCYHRPLLPDAYSDEDWSVRPAPWEMGQEYDGATLGEHLPGVAVVPSNFMHSTFDEFVIWNTTLSDAEVASNAQGVLVREADVNIRYTFDLDDLEDCRDRQLWDLSLRCYGVNEAHGRTAPSAAFPWTNAPIGDVDRPVSPFPLVAGSTIHKTMSAGTCAVATLQGSDADGDTLTYSLVEDITTIALESGQNLSLSGSSLTLCDSSSGESGLKNVSFNFDVCDTFDACASETSGVGTVIFHILPPGPGIVAFQLDGEEDVRIVFDADTSCVDVSTVESLKVLLTFSNSEMVPKEAKWETGGCHVLRVEMEEDMDSSVLGSTVTLNKAGLLRGSGGISYPAIATSPGLELVTCEDGYVLLPGAMACTQCPSGSVPQEDDDTDMMGCFPCAAGTAGTVSCEACEVGYFANGTGMTECVPCPAGTYCDSTGSIDPTECAQGFYQPSVGQSTCRRCARGEYSDLPGSLACTSCPEGYTTEGTGYASPLDCECSDGYFRASTDECIACGDGASCTGFGSPPKALAGYHLYSVDADHLDIFECSSEPRRCPGGEVGVCAAGRTGIACAECVAGKTPGNDGTCTECSSGDSFIFASIAAVIVLIMAFLYRRVAVHDGVRMKQEVLLSITTTAQLLFVLQVSAIMSRMVIEWPEPMRSFISFFSIFTFELKFFRLGCVTAVSELTTYLLKLAVLPSIILALTVLHIFYCLVRKKSPWAERSALLGAIGIFVTSLYAALTSSIASPFQCFQHPNKRWTMKAAQATLCWEGGEHVLMLVFAMLASLFLVLVFVWIVRLVQVYPRRMLHGDVRFLNTYSFLFLRVRPSARWFIVFFLARNGIIALIPSIPNGFWQSFAMICAFACSTNVVVRVMPWKVHEANLFEIAACFIFQATVILALPFAASASDLSVLPEVALVLFTLCFTAAPLALLRWALLRACRTAKAYRFFLSHQKASAGAFARLMKISLMQQLDCGVFLDSDDLVDLTKLFSYVRCDTKSMVALCTKEILLSPWCLGELSMATLHKIPLFAVRFPEFSAPTDADIESVADRISITSLAHTGLSLEDVQLGMRGLREAKSVACFSAYSENGLETLLANLCDMEVEAHQASFRSSSFGAAGRNSKSWWKSTSSSSEKNSHAVLVDPANTEAQAAGMILTMMLRPLMSDVCSFVVIKLEDERVVWPKAVEAAIILCTPGCFLSSPFLHVLLQFIHSRVDLVLPVAASSDFTFPRGDFYLELEGRVGRLCHDAGVEEIRDLLTPFTRSLFQKIFSRFSVLDSQVILETQAAIIAARLRTPESLKIGLEDVLPSGSYIVGALLTEMETPMVDLDELCAAKAKSETTAATPQRC